MLSLPRPTSLLAPLLTSLSKHLVLSLLMRITAGTLVVRSEPDNDVWLFPGSADPSDGDGDGDGDGAEFSAEITVVRPTFWVRVALGGDVGFAEAYMFGDVECADLSALFMLYIANRAHFLALRTPLAALMAVPTKILGSIPRAMISLSALGPLEQARRDIAAHYDLSDRMFRAFLSEDMTYSCAIFPEYDGDLYAPQSSPSPSQRAETSSVSLSLSPSNLSLAPSPSSTTTLLPPTDPLGHAQLLKLQHLTHLLQLPSPSLTTTPPFRILEIGSGWGSLALHLAAAHPSLSIDTLTLSTSQFSHVSARIKALRLGARVRVHLLDFRALPSLPSWQGAFDRAVSVEMIEALPTAHLPLFFRTLSACLRPTGVLVLQAITLPSPLIPAYRAKEDFIQRYIFPGGGLHGLEELLGCAGGEGWGTERVEGVGRHYARTLREWGGRFERAWDEQERGREGERQRARAGESEGERAGEGEKGLAASGEGEEDDEHEPWAPAGEEGEVFRRKWRYYFAYCEAGFTMRVLDDHIITFTKVGNREYGVGVFE